MNLLQKLDDWVEIPCGEFIDGLTERNRQRLNEQMQAMLRAMPLAYSAHLIRHLRNDITLEDYPPDTRDRIMELERLLFSNSALPQQKRAAQMESIRLRTELRPAADPSIPDTARMMLLHLRYELKEPGLEQARSLSSIEDMELRLYHRQHPEQTLTLNTFYIARFPITVNQQNSLDARERGPNVRRDGRHAVKVTPEAAEQMCASIGARLPTAEEWKKAAIGTDGRLYPWGNEWNPNAGYFSYAQNAPQEFNVDGFPEGVSPYGVWNMIGGLPEWVLQGEQLTSWGQHPKEIDYKMAWLYHVPVFGGYHPGGLSWPPTGTGVRPVMDRWPKHYF